MDVRERVNEAPSLGVRHCDVLCCAVQCGAVQGMAWHGKAVRGGTSVMHAFSRFRSVFRMLLMKSHSSLKFKMSSWSALSRIVSLSTLASSASAAVTFRTDRAAFRANLISGSLNFVRSKACDLESLALDAFPSSNAFFPLLPGLRLSYALDSFILLIPSWKRFLLQFPRATNG